VRRFFVRPEAVEGDRVQLDSAEARHLARVLRVGPGARIEVADGAGRSFVVRLITIGPEGGVGRIEGEAPGAPESPCAITLGQAILKGNHMAWLVQKATELGVARIVPIETVRGVVRGARAEQQRARWARVAREAMKQCGRAVAPSVETPRPLAALAGEAAAHDAAWLLWEGGGEPVGVAAGVAGRPRRGGGARPSRRGPGGQPGAEDPARGFRCRGRGHPLPASLRGPRVRPRGSGDGFG